MSMDIDFTGEGHIDDSSSRENTPSHSPSITRSAESSTLKPSQLGESMSTITANLPRISMVEGINFNEKRIADSSAATGHIAKSEKKKKKVSDGN